ncbi:MAG: DNA repair protein RecO, partial [Calditrichaeota bacterium]|nr:DNA repair protein RecO [Calditrichota bacterium]
MELRQSSGIVIRQINWSDTSKIITLFSRDFGKIQLIARGARSPKSKFRGVVDLLNVISFSYQYKAGRDLNYLADPDLDLSMHSVSEQYESYIFSLAIIELLDQLMELDDSHQRLYDELIEIFRLLKSGDDPRFMFIRFLLRFAMELGFELNMRF